MTDQTQQPDHEPDESTDHSADHSTDHSAGQSGGQVSEVGSMDPAEADTPISDDQAVAGYPESESGAPDEPDEAGPNAKPGDNRRANDV